MELANYIYGFGFVGLFISALNYIAILPSKRSEKNFITMVKDSVESFYSVLSSVRVWVLSLYGMMMYVPLIVLGDFAGISFIERRYGLSEVLSTNIFVWMYVGIILGTPFFAYISDAFKNRKIAMAFGALFCLLSYSMVLYNDSISETWMRVFLFLAGFSLVQRV